MFKFVHIVETELVAAAAIKFDEILVQFLLSKNHVLLKGAALIKVRPLIPFLRYILHSSSLQLLYLNENQMNNHLNMPISTKLDGT